MYTRSACVTHLPLLHSAVLWVLNTDVSLLSSGTLCVLHCIGLRSVAPSRKGDQRAAY